MIAALLTLAQMAQPACDARAASFAKLASRYGEAPEFAGIVTNDAIVVRP